MIRKILLPIFLLAFIAAGVWLVLRYRSQHRYESSNTLAVNLSNNATAAADANAWVAALEKIKEPRSAEENVAVETPPELRHYSERHLFLATQVAEIAKYNVQTCQDFVELAELINRGEIVSVPAVSETYVLYGVAQKADDDVFSRFEDSDRLNGDTSTSQQPPQNYPALEALAKNFVGRSYDLNIPSDRQALKVNMLRTLRPQALKVLEEVAAAYQGQFRRPLPVSSLVRPEQYQHALRRVNRNAVLIETPPHSTGLAFDIDYRYMSGAEQNFVMAHLARLKQEGRIEVIRESNANYHVFAFVNGSRPNDELITASLDKAQAPTPEANHASPAKPAPEKSRASKAKSRVAKKAAKSTKSKPRKRRR